MIDRSDCMYCARTQELYDAMAEVVELQSSWVYLSRGNRYPGRCIVACKAHVRELCDLGDRQRDRYMREVSRVAAAIREGFAPDKINYAVYGDIVSHLHFHLVPKYRGGPEWGLPFIANPEDWTAMTEAKTEQCLAVLRRSLNVFK